MLLFFIIAILCIRKVIDVVTEECILKQDKFIVSIVSDFEIA